MNQSTVMNHEWSAIGGWKLLFISALVPFMLHALVEPVPAAEISSKAAVVIDASTGRILYGKNPNLRLPPASTTKLMTAMVALDRKNPDDTVTISARAAAVSPVKAHFRAGERTTIGTLLHAALIKSANDAALALAEATAGSEERFVELMNQKTIALAMSDTNFTNATGLPGHGQYTTGYDLAKMLRHALRYPQIREIINIKASRISTEDGRSIFIKNSNRLLWSDESVVGGKTGYTREAKHCFVCASEQGSETLIVALLGAPSREKLWRESEDLLERGSAIMTGKEDPVMYFSRSDYRTTIQPASYSVQAQEGKDLSAKKSATKAKAKGMKQRTAQKKTSKKYAKGKSKAVTKAEGKRNDGPKG